jgi:thiamine-monophosphate kinase
MTGPSQEITGKSLAQVGERSLLKYIISRLKQPEKALLQPGDDAAAFNWEGGLVTCLDVLVAETDVPPGMDWEKAGCKAVVAVVSDMAAKSASPKYLLVGLGLRGDMSMDDFKALWHGLESTASLYGASIIGGDLNQCSSPFISVTAIGAAVKTLSRSGARPGNLVACTGLFGSTAAGLHALLNGIPDAASPRLLEKVLSPRARLREGLALGRIEGVTSCVDSSDGLAESLHCIAEASGVGIHLTSLPVDPEAREYADKHGLDFLKMVLYGGEEYELIFTFEEEYLGDVQRALGGCFNIIGSVVGGGGVTFEHAGKMVEVARIGWEHFLKR